MTDLGFGLVDRRSVMIVLFTFVISNAVFGNAIPIDTSTATAAFVSLVIITGFIYFTRAICRIFLALVYTVIVLPLDLYNNVRWNEQRTDGVQEKYHTLVFHTIAETFEERFRLPLFDYQDWHPPEPLKDIGSPRGLVEYTVGKLGVFDRILLVVVSFVATLKSSPVPRESLGLIGIVILVLVYVWTGRFTFILKDAFHKTEEERKELVEATKKPKIEFPRVVYTKPEPPDYG